MVDIHTEELITLETARLLFPGRRPSKRVELSTVWRWCTKGVLCNGRRIKLGSIVAGGRRYTSREAVARFLDELNPEVKPSACRSQSARRKASERAGRELGGMLGSGR